MANPRYEPRYNNQKIIDYDNPARAGAKRMSKFSSVPADPENTSWQDSVNGYDASFVESPSLTFNGTDNYMNLGNPAYLNFIPRTDSFEIEFGISNFDGSADVAVIDKRSVGDTTTSLLINLYANFDVYVGGVRTRFSETVLTDSKPHTVRIEIPAAATGLKVYIDNTIQTPTAGDSSIGTDENTASNITFCAKYDISAFLDGSISYLKFTKNGTLVAQFPMSEGEYDDVSDTENDLQVTMEGTTSNIWDNTQDSFHYNITKGFDKWTLDADGSILEVPYQSDGTPSLTNGDAIAGHTWVSTHPYIPQGHNGCSTKFLMPAGNTALIAADYQNLWYDGSQDPIANTFQNIPTRIGQNDLLGRYGSMLSDTNGDGLPDGFTAANSTGLTLINNVLSFTATSSGGQVNVPSGIGTIVGHEYYMRASIDGDSSNVGLATEAATLGIAHSGGGEYEDLSFAFTATSTAQLARIMDINSTGWQAISVKDLTYFDKTDLFKGLHMLIPSQDILDRDYLKYLGMDIATAKDNTAKTAKGMTVYHRKQDAYDSTIIQRRKGITE